MVVVLVSAEPDTFADYCFQCHYSLSNEDMIIYVMHHLLKGGNEETESGCGIQNQTFYAFIYIHAALSLPFLHCKKCQLFLHNMETVFSRHSWDALWVGYRLDNCWKSLIKNLDIRRPFHHCQNPQIGHISLLAPWINLVRLELVQVDCHEDIYSFPDIQFSMPSYGIQGH
jgi:hypothetical protein